MHAFLIKGQRTFLKEQYAAMESWDSIDELMQHLTCAVFAQGLLSALESEFIYCKSLWVKASAESISTLSLIAITVYQDPNLIFLLFHMTLISVLSIGYAHSTQDICQQGF